MNKKRYIPIGITIILALLLVIGSPSPYITAVFGVFLLISVVYYFLGYPKHAQPDAQLAQGYFVALAVQCLHFMEEYIGAIYSKLPALLEIPAIEKDAFVLFNLGAYAIFILGGIPIFRKMRYFMIIPIFFILFGVMANGIIHVLLTLWSGSYFPGLYTALIYLLLGPYLLRLLQADSQFTSNELGR